MRPSSKALAGAPGVAQDWELNSEVPSIVVPLSGLLILGELRSHREILPE